MVFTISFVFPYIFFIVLNVWIIIVTDVIDKVNNEHKTTLKST